MKHHSFKNKKSNALLDTMVIGIFIFIAAVGFMYSFSAFKEVKPLLDEEITFEQANETYQDLYVRTPKALDSAILVMLVTLWIGTLALSTLVDTHPIFFALAAIVMVSVLIVGGILANTYIELVLDIEMEDDFPISYFIFDHFIGFILGFISTIFIALYAKRR